MPISAPKIPDGLPELMRGLAKSVIKENPENLYVHAAEYFENLIRERDGELDRGYQGFNAYQVYADYKEQTREKLGLAPTKQPSASDGEDAGDTGSGDSGSRSRGRRRRRTRNQPSTEKDSSMPVAGGPDNGGSEVTKQKSLSEDSVEPVSVVEDEVTKVHYNPPEAAPPGRVVSAQSVEAEQAVLTVLEDDQILDSDGKDTAEEDDPVQRAEDDDIGTAPSTAEITEETAPAVFEPSIENEEIPLQDLETCFMHANVDHLLEKHSGVIAEGPVVGDLKKGDSKATENAAKQEQPHPVPAVDENVTGVPVLESGNLVEKPEDSNTDPAPVPSEADEPIEKPTEVQLVGQDIPEGKINPMNRSEDVKKSLSRNGSKENEVDPKQNPATDKPEPGKAPVEHEKPEDVPVPDGGHNQDNEEIRGSEPIISPKHEPASTAPSGVSRQTSIEATELPVTTEPTNIEEPNRVAPIDVGLEPDVGVSEQDDAKKDERTKNDDAQNITAAEPFEPAVPEADVTEDPKEDPKDEGPRPGSAKPSSPEQSLEEVVEEPCIKREVSPSKTLPPAEREESIDSSKDQELEEIKKVDLSQLSKDSAEALFYSLKKSALENQDPEGSPVDDHPSTELGEAPKSRDSNGGGDDDDDKDVVVTEEPPAATAPEDTAKRTFTDDFLDESPLPEDTRRAEAPSDAPVNIPEATAPEEKRSCGSAEAEDDLTPMETASMRLKQFQDAMHGRADTIEGEGDAASGKRPVMRRCMTEMAELQRYVSADESADPSYVEEEDQFDGYYIGHIKNKILASSVSVADSDCFDPARGSPVESVDENNVRTALETIASTDTESTIASQATIQQAAAGKRSYLQKHSQNTSSNIPYASFGNAAIDKSLDEFIEREERNKQDEAFAEAATKIQRSYRTHKKRLYHSTMRTCTEDASAESGGEEPSNVIQIKLDQKRATDLGRALSDGGEESPDPSGAGSLHVPLGGRPMQSLNIDEYDTVTRRQMLTRGVAMQRNSTPDDDSGKSTNASTDRRSSLSGGGPVASDSPPEGQLLAAEPTAATTSGSSEEHDGDHKSPGSKTPGDDREPAALKGALARSSSTGQRAPMDVQSLLLVARQRTMPVQIDSSVIRVLPKHMRKRISSADLPNGGKRK
ncbi:uncharacterized protein LOC128274829 [Anopheles cruzii]|uniref:uncharacterized protein LOC128274829 n=1 Tax=Anopheles cruzii TaxID=68878 RepID=UPI0022EC9075|nr:uncharacterized protein LOC128274829 [Anopheles cruzii]